jgi:hypothetical protein
VKEERLTPMREQRGCDIRAMQTGGRYPAVVRPGRSRATRLSSRRFFSFHHANVTTSTIVTCSKWTSRKCASASRGAGSHLPIDIDPYRRIGAAVSALAKVLHLVHGRQELETDVLKSVFTLGNLVCVPEGVLDLGEGIALTDPRTQNKPYNGSLDAVLLSQERHRDDVVSFQ